MQGNHENARTEPLRTPEIGKTGRRCPFNVLTDWELIRNQVVILDTETTGLGPRDEVVEVSMINGDGVELFSSLIRPTIDIPASVTAIHGITNADVALAPTWLEVCAKVRYLLHKKILVCWNSSFDPRLISQSCKAHNLEEINLWDIAIACAKTDYEHWRNIPDEKRPGGRKYISLENAAKYQGIELPSVRHRALADCLLTLAVIQSAHHDITSTKNQGALA